MKNLTLAEKNALIGAVQVGQIKGGFKPGRTWCTAALSIAAQVAERQEAEIVPQNGRTAAKTIAETLINTGAAEGLISILGVGGHKSTEAPQNAFKRAFVGEVSVTRKGGRPRKAKTLTSTERSRASRARQRAAARKSYVNCEQQGGRAS